MKPDTVSLREIIIRKRYNKERWGDAEGSFDTMLELINWVHWGETPEGWGFWLKLCRYIRYRFPEAEDVLLQSKPWR